MAPTTTVAILAVNEEAVPKAVVLLRWLSVGVTVALVTSISPAAELPIKVAWSA